MRILYVVHRYGAGISGGAEGACRALATRLAGRGHQVEVVTSRAVDYLRWRDALPLGDETDDGVTVHRLPVARPRDPVRFDALNRRVSAGEGDVSAIVEDAWMAAQGPVLDGLEPWLATNAGRFDVAVFLPYLYWTTAAGLPAAAGRVATVVHPAAHDEAQLGLPLFRLLLRHASAFGFFTPEEEDLVRRRLGVRAPGAVVPIGVDPAPAADPTAFRRRFGLGDDPYLLYVGRLDPAKGVDELVADFATYKARRPGPLRLVLVGDAVHPVEPHPDIVMTGFADDADKHAALAGAMALVQPSRYESFSIVVAEAWSHGVPVIAQGGSEVLAGQCRRSGGGIPYVGYAELEVALDLLAADPAVGARLGRAGRRYVEAELAWDGVLDRYEQLLRRAASGRGAPALRAR